MIRGLVISQSFDSISVDASNVTIAGNFVGTQADGTSPMPNGNFGGINLLFSNAIVGGAGAGEPNTIAFNNGPGIWARLNANSNALVRNVIYANTMQGITLQDAFPAIPLPNDAGDVDTAPGSQASRSYRIEFYANAACGSTGYGQGQTAGT